MKKRFKSTKDIPIPKNPFEQVIGQEVAVEIAKISAKQRRHLLLVGPPGVGKSMIAKAISTLLPKPRFEISVVHNSEMPEKPLVEVRNKSQILKVEKPTYGRIVPHTSIPISVAEKLGYRCKRCGGYTDPNSLFCGSCGAERAYMGRNPFEDLLLRGKRSEPTSVIVKIETDNGVEEVVYERIDSERVRVLKKEDLIKRKKYEKERRRKIIVPLDRSLFVRAAAASETELLGDVKHDPYGDHKEIGTPAYKRVVAGAIHEAHEGVLFIDELSTMEDLQRYILTAMQDKTFPIVGRNPTSAGASVKVDAVPCDFILIGATNIMDLHKLIPPLRSRIRGEGYEVLLKTWMPDTSENRYKVAQFIAQEIRKDGKVPPADKGAIEEIISYGKKIAKEIDSVEGLTLRFRNLVGLIKLSGDLASIEGSEFIKRKHVKKAEKNAKTIEEQILEYYGNNWNALYADYGHRRHKSGTEIV